MNLGNVMIKFINHTGISLPIDEGNGRILIAPGEQRASISCEMSITYSLYYELDDGLHDKYKILWENNITSDPSVQIEYLRTSRRFLLKHERSGISYIGVGRTISRQIGELRFSLTRDPDGQTGPLFICKGHENQKNLTVVATKE